MVSRKRRAPCQNRRRRRPARRARGRSGGRAGPGARRSAPPAAAPAARPLCADHRRTRTRSAAASALRGGSRWRGAETCCRRCRHSARLWAALCAAATARPGAQRQRSAGELAALGSAWWSVGRRTPAPRRPLPPVSTMEEEPSCPPRTRVGARGRAAGGRGGAGQGGARRGTRRAEEPFRLRTKARPGPRRRAAAAGTPIRAAHAPASFPACWACWAPTCACYLPRLSVVPARERHAA